MGRRLKERLIGAVVLLLVAVIFIPMILDDSIQRDTGITGSNIPEKPDQGFGEQLVPLQATDIKLPPPNPLAMEPAPETGSEPDVAPVLQPVTEPEPVPEPVRKEPVPAKKASLPKASAWVIQLGSFSSEANATALDEKLRKAGYPSFVEAQQLKSGTSYRVRVGPELLRSDAQALREELKKFIKMDGIVIQYP